MKRIRRSLTGTVLIILAACSAQIASAAPLVESQFNATSTAFFPINTTNDLVLAGANTLTSSSYTGSIFFGTLSSINDGQLGGSTVATTATATQTLYFGNQDGPGVPGSVTFNLNTSTNILGYDISSLNVFGGWNQKAIFQNFTVTYTTVSSSTPMTLTSVNYLPFPNATATGEYSSLTTITSDNSAPLVSGVNSITFSFNPHDFSGDIRSTVLREISVIGTATVPEPSVVGTLLLGFAVAGFAFLKRRPNRTASI
jgi:hypothetical protein